MKKNILLSLCCCISLCTYSQTVPSDWKQKEQYAFVENKGQIRNQYGQPRNDIGFRLQSADVTVLISNTTIHYQWQQTEPVKVERLAKQKDMKVKSYRMDVTLVNANKNALVLKEEEQDFYEQYYQQHLGLNGTIAHAYQKVTYQDVYPGIDWVLYLVNDQSGIQSMKYDFIVRPGANVADIKLQYDGATTLSLSEDGSLVAATPMGTIKEDAPYTYTLAADQSGQRTKVNSQFVLTDNLLSFRTADYEGTLVIDPTLEWATYYGGAGFDLGTVLTCDNSGNVYLTGASWMGQNIATDGSHQSTNAGDFDAFLAKFDTDGNRLWATYYGGVSLDYGFGLVCDANDRVYLSGVSHSTSGISTPGSHQEVNAGGGDNFLVRFDSSGSLIWATYYGSTGEEYNGLCATDNMGYIYLAGNTNGNNIASNGHQSTFGGGMNDAYLVKFDTMGVRQWATYYGGADNDESNGVACDGIGNVYLGGYTNSSSAIATTGSHQPALGGDYDGFLVKFNNAGVRQWGTYYGGSEYENTGYFRCVAADKNDNVYLAGHSESTDAIATPGSHQAALAGGSDGFLVKFNNMGVRSWATYLGGTADENGGAIACDFSNKIFWSGFTKSTSGIVTADGYQDTYGGPDNDAFLTRFSSDGVQEYGTYYGGGSLDEGYAVAFDNVGNAYISGGTTSNNNIATPGAFSTIYNGGIAVFLAKFCTSVTTPSISGPDTACPNTAIQFTASALSGATGYIWTLPPGWTGSSNTNIIDVITNGQSGTVSVQTIRCDTSSPQSISVYVQPEVPAVIIADGFVLSTTNTHSGYQWYLNDNLIAGATNPTYTAVEDGSYRVVVTNNPGNCMDTSAAIEIAGVSVSDVATGSAAIHIYPNPSTDWLHIDAAQMVSIKIYSVEGKIVAQQDKAKVVDISKLSSGLYLVKITDLKGNLIGTKKFIKTTE